MMATILAVDDDAKIRGLLATLLARKGHHVLTANHGQQGIDLFRRERPQATILDFEMPEMDGLAVLKEIRAIDPLAPVIMLTGAGTEEREARARALGVTDFLAKGFSLHELGAALKKVLPSSEPNQPLSGRRA
ncbi:response regulator [Nitrospira moscoviensis]|uniref:Two-component response regulator n=1 Tax=Nitrospira moscoviensis TaxID=42253 RepID=A0A0K2GFM9_NITMO|nr:response regulator [Nitrospira moscoviensis]ALA59659.1 two-component response regulator [Nitrospira moscoviensis]